MPKVHIGAISGLIVILSIIPYAIRTYQRKINPNPTSWSLWAFIGLAILFTYKDSGAQDNLWPAIFSFTNPTLISVLTIARREKWKPPDGFEIVCAVFGIASIITWWNVRQDPTMAAYALYLAIAADLAIAIPTIRDVWSNPKIDRPFAWFCFALGYLLAFFAVPEPSFANYILPAYMSTAGLIIGYPLAMYRYKLGAPAMEWI